MERKNRRARERIGKGKRSLQGTPKLNVEVNVAKKVKGNGQENMTRNAKRTRECSRERQGQREGEHRRERPEPRRTCKE